MHEIGGGSAESDDRGAEVDTPPGDFHVRMTFIKDGPAIDGTWADGEVALRKFRGLVGTHGSVPGVAITLKVEAGNEQEPLRTWAEGVEVIHRDL
ncbi:hypothetical protein [Streptomyces sp. NBC_00582]|uniref:hypothetical protein n=1 Tax=Streptomyces sp. NBC_00582 TaxID=2975783 RepID=UPI002E8216B5|nr:hypothetical protein [Streptomyces sp. NBC_00582]WUB68464.1 hypothetical protein OG852_50070 [Streptomyces sp. NBC_00582]